MAIACKFLESDAADFFKVSVTCVRVTINSKDKY